MKKNARKRNNRSSNNKYLVAGMAMSSALVLSSPVIPSLIYANNANKYSWTKQELDLIGGETINQVASSATGSSLIASSYDFGTEPVQPFPLYVSNDSGASWQNVANAADPGVANTWTSVDISSDGQTMVAASYSGKDLDAEIGQQYIPGKVVLSRNAGINWTDITSDLPINGGETYVAISGDSSTIVVAAGGQVSITEDDGNSWSSTYVEGNAENNAGISNVSISNDGNKLLAGVSGSGSEFDDFYASEDGGASWTGIAPEPGLDMVFTNTAISPDGNKFAVAGINGETDRVYVSNNSGGTWANITPENDNWDLWTSVDMSEDGTTIAVFGPSLSTLDGGESASMYVSGDSGANWTQENIDENNTGSFLDFYGGSNVDLNSNGSRVAVGRVGGVYTGNKIAPANPTVSLTDPHGGKTITLTTLEGTTITCHSAVKESGLPAQDNTYSYPLGLVDFCFNTQSENNEVILTFVTDLKPNQVKARKYNTSNQTYFDIPNAIITQTTHQGQPALRLAYTITDNGQLDLDPTVGGIKDPVGLALVAGALADTGQAQTALVLLSAVLTLPATLYIISRRKSQS